MLLQSVPTVIHAASKGVEVGADGVLETGEGLPLVEGFFECLTSWHQALGLPTRHSYPGKKHVCPHLMMHILLENSVFLMI